MRILMSTVLSIQTALARRVAIQGCSIMTAIHKQPVAGPVGVQRLGLIGDEQADLSVHGGLDKAIYAYPVEHYGFWQIARSQAGIGQADQTLPHGMLGENLTLEGVLESDLWIGDLLKFEQCTLRVTQPREPCYKFNFAMGFSGAAKAMALQGCCGFYLAVDEPGYLRAGESFEVLSGSRGLRVSEAFRAKMIKHLR